MSTNSDTNLPDTALRIADDVISNEANGISIENERFPVYVDVPIPVLVDDTDNSNNAVANAPLEAALLNERIPITQPETSGVLDTDYEPIEDIDETGYVTDDILGDVDPNPASDTVASEGRHINETSDIDDEPPQQDTHAVQPTDASLRGDELWDEDSGSVLDEDGSGASCTVDAVSPPPDDAFRSPVEAPLSNSSTQAVEPSTIDQPLEASLVGNSVAIDTRRGRQSRNFDQEEPVLVGPHDVYVAPDFVHNVNDDMIVRDAVPVPNALEIYADAEPIQRVAAVPAPSERCGGKFHDPKFQCFTALMIVIVGLCISLPIIYGGKNSPLLETTPPPPVITTSNNIPRAEAIFNVLAKVSDADVLRELNTPHELAFKWIAVEDYAEVPVNATEWIIQRYVGALVYYSLGGTNINFEFHIISAVHECYFKGVICNEDKQITTLDLDGLFYLEGTIPHEVSMFTHLERLDLDSDANGDWIDGTIPSSLGSLTALRHLSAQHNSLSGSIPEALGDLSSLTYLNLSNNKLSGEVPSSLAKLKSLDTLYLYGNNIEGSAEFLCKSLNVKQFVVDEEKVSCSCCISLPVR